MDIVKKVRRLCGKRQASMSTEVPPPSPTSPENALDAAFKSFEAEIHQQWVQITARNQARRSQVMNGLADVIDKLDSILHGGKNPKVISDEKVELITGELTATRDDVAKELKNVQDVLSGSPAPEGDKLTALNNYKAIVEANNKVQEHLHTTWNEFLAARHNLDDDPGTFDAVSVMYRETFQKAQTFGEQMMTQQKLYRDYIAALYAEGTTDADKQAKKAIADEAYNKAKEFVASSDNPVPGMTHLAHRNPFAPAPARPPVACPCPFSARAPAPAPAPIAAPAPAPPSPPPAPMFAAPTSPFVPSGRRRQKQEQAGAFFKI